MRRRPNLLIASLLVLSCSVFSQKPIISYDLIDQSIDTLPIPQLDSTSTLDSYPHHPGNRHIATLDSVFPLENLQPNSNFTFKSRVNEHYDVNSFPFSTTVKIFSLMEGELIKNCTGNFIHKRHVLSAAHCFFEVGSNTPRPENDTLYICPMFDNGEAHNSYPCLQVIQLHSFQDWNLDSTDFAVLTISEPVGAFLGYLGLGFDQNSDELERQLFYKFSYPNQSLMHPGRYNGDSLYFAYGGINTNQGPYLKIDNTFCEFGESGSHLVQVENNVTYRTLGSLTYGIDCKHNRVDRNIFYSLKNLVTDGTVQNHEKKADAPSIHILPNPFQNSIKIQSAEKVLNSKYNVFNLNGSMVDNGQVNNSGQIDLSHLAVGIYFLRLIVDDSSMMVKISKNR